MNKGLCSNMDESSLCSVQVKEAGRLVASFDLDPCLITVANLKILVEAETGMEPAMQRLISRGRVLRDHDLLSDYLSATDGSSAKAMIIFLAEQPKTRDEPTAKRPVSKKPSSDIRSQALAPLASAMSKNPEMLEKMFTSNPQVQAMMEKNPQLRHALSDPKTLQDMFNMSTNKTYYQEAMRGHDRALSNLENLPQGFQHLVQMQKSLSGAESLRVGDDRPSKTNITKSTPKKAITSKPFPNPWNNRFDGFGEDLFGIQSDDDFLEDLKRLRKPHDKPPALSTSKEPSPPSDLSHYSARFHRQLQVLKDLGFQDEDENIRALLQTGGNVSAAIEWLVSRRNL